VIAAARRDPSARSQVSFPPGGRMISTCGDPPSGSPVPGSSSTVSTLTGVSSVPSAGSAASAACIASSNPTSCSRPASRLAALSTNPADTGMPSSADQVRGPLGGHVPEPGPQHRGGIDTRP
jgi:hypothetical protein